MRTVEAVPTTPPMMASSPRGSENFEFEAITEDEPNPEQLLRPGAISGDLTVRDEHGTPLGLVLKSRYDSYCDMFTALESDSGDRAIERIEKVITECFTFLTPY